MLNDTFCELCSSCIKCWRFTHDCCVDYEVQSRSCPIHHLIGNDSSRIMIDHKRRCDLIWYQYDLLPKCNVNLGFCSPCNINWFISILIIAFLRIENLVGITYFPFAIENMCVSVSQICSKNAQSINESKLSELAAKKVSSSAGSS